MKSAPAPALPALPHPALPALTPSTLPALTPSTLPALSPFIRAAPVLALGIALGLLARPLAIATRPALSPFIRAAPVLALGIALGLLARPLAIATSPNAADTFQRVREDILNRHPSPPTLDTLTYAAIHGMMSPLDRWTRFYAPSEVSALTADPADIGIDATVEPSECGLTVTTVAGVAAKAGLRVGDCIVAVDGANLRGTAGEARAARLLGPSRSASVLEVQRDVRGDGGARGPELVAVRRGWRGGAPLELAEVPGSALGSSATWLSVRSFPGGVTELWPRATSTVASQGLVVDLRGNPGGEMTEAVRFVDRFATEGFVVGADVRGEQPKVYSASNDGDEVRGPVVVLVDEGTASAAEIAAAALRERVGAIVVGRPTVGKRAIETIIRYEDGSALQLTIGRFEVAGGGLPIDVLVPEGANEAAWVDAAFAGLERYPKK